MSVAQVVDLPDNRRQRLKDLERTIVSGFDGIVAIGEALREIRDDGLYLELDGGLTFETYCKTRWSISPSYAYRQIDAADVHEAISPMGETAVPVMNERVGRELAVVLHNGGPAKVAEAWAKVSAAYAGQRPPTAVEVNRILRAEGYRTNVGQVSGGATSLRVHLGQVGDRIAATEKRLEWFLSRDLPSSKREPSQSTRDLAARYAHQCDQLAQLLRAFAEGREP